jgi:hypothetical protein
MTFDVSFSFDDADAAVHLDGPFGCSLHLSSEAGDVVLRFSDDYALESILDDALHKLLMQRQARDAQESLPLPFVNNVVRAMRDAKLVPPVVDDDIQRIVSNAVDEYKAKEAGLR